MENPKQPDAEPPGGISPEHWEALRPTPVVLGEEGQAISAEVLMKVLQAKIGDAVGAFSMDPGAAHKRAAADKNPLWTYFAPEPSLVTRIAKDEWQIAIGSHYRKTMNGEEIVEALVKTLHGLLQERPDPPPEVSEALPD